MAIVRETPPFKEPKLTESIAINALAIRFNPWQNWIFHNVHFCGGEMDFAFVTKSMYLAEIEIKLTRADWMNDMKKRKWFGIDRRKISRFYYAVPEKLAENIPEFVPPEAGIISIRFGEYNGLFYTREERKAKRQGEKISEEELVKLKESLYYKHWKGRFRECENQPQPI